MDPRHGRGAVLMSAATLLVAFGVPFVRSRGVSASALEVAIDGATNLWMVPVAAIAVLLILARRKTLAAMRRSRLAIAGLFVGALLPLGYTVRRIDLMAAAQSADVLWRAGLWLAVASCIVGIVSTPWLGRDRR